MPNLIHVTRCILCPAESAWQIDARSFDPVNVFQPEPRVERFVLELFKHISETAAREDKAAAKILPTLKTPLDIQAWMLEHGKHLALANNITVNTKLAQSFAMLSGFHSQDPELQAAKEAARMVLHAMTARRLDDDTIRQGIAQLGFVDGQADTVFQFVRALLDASNGVRQQQPESRPLVTL